jgi:hypothetical protein
VCSGVYKGARRGKRGRQAVLQPFYRRGGRAARGLRDRGDRGCGGTWREEKHEKGMATTAWSRHARAAQRVRTGEAPGSLMHRTRPAAGEGGRREARGRVGRSRKKMGWAEPG